MNLLRSCKTFMYLIVGVMKYLSLILLCGMFVFPPSIVYSQPEATTEVSPKLAIDQRITIVERKIEGGLLRGDLTRNEYSRLKPKLAVVKYKREKIEKEGVTEQAYKDLDHYLYGLEHDTDRLINKFQGQFSR